LARALSTLSALIARPHVVGVGHGCTASGRLSLFWFAFVGPLSPSRAIGVGQRFANVESEGAPLPANASLPSPGHPFCPLPYALAVGVGHCFTSRGRFRPPRVGVPFAPLLSEAQGVAHDEDPSSEVRSPNVGGRKRDGSCIVAKSVQRGPHLAQPEGFAAGDVFDDDRGRPELFDDAGELEPEPAARAVKPALLAGCGDVLAGESAANDIDICKGVPSVRSPDVPDIRVPPDGGIVPL
jgi:hypothetical protein